MTQPSLLRLAILTGVTLTAFAGNSILARMALRDGAIDPVAYTSLRLISGALFVSLVVLWQSRSASELVVFKWKPALSLFGYAITFSLAYLSLDAGLGALLLFSAVQATMIGSAILRGDHPGRTEWIGITVALAGFGWLMLPGTSAPPFIGAGLMILSGIFWGLYSLYGQGESNPVAATGRNFLWTVPLAALLYFLPGAFETVSTRGLLLALASGTITSGLGYIVWYETLKFLKTTTAAVVQLAVPVIAGFGGILLMSEVLSLRLMLASILIIGGIYVTIRGGQQRRG